MSVSFVLDASVTLSWCFQDEATEETRRILDRMVVEAAVVPGLWSLEVVNVLALAERADRIEPAQTATFIELLRTLRIEVEEIFPGSAFDRLLELCRKHALTSYDAAYLDLALRRNLPLASLDERLRRVAGSLGIEVLG
ncbi:MAG: type II toxin-antitoxin system VapC family toxin [bacterium]